MPSNSWIFALACAAFGISSTVAVAASADTPYYTITDFGTIDQVASDVNPGLNGKGQITRWRLVDNSGYRPVIQWDDQQRVLDAPKGYLNEFAYSLNDHGDAAGWANTTQNPVDSLSTMHAVYIHKGKAIDLGTLGGKNSRAYALNNGSVVVGAADLPDKSSRAFRYSAGHMEALDPLAGGNFSVAFGVNEAGVVAGGAAIEDSKVPVQPVHAVLWHGVKPQDLGVLVPDRSSVAYAVNNRNDAVGVADTHADQTAFLYSQGRMTDLGIETGRPYSINDNRQIVGIREGTERGYMVGWLWENGTTYALNDCIPPKTGYWIESGVRINNAGQIVCTARLDKRVHVILLTPAKRP